MPEGKNPKESAVAKLQYSVDLACRTIHDGSSSYAIRVRRAAKRGVEKNVALKGLGAMEEAISDAREAIERAYSPAEKREAPKSRVALLG